MNRNEIEEKRKECLYKQNTIAEAIELLAKYKFDYDYADYIIEVLEKERSVLKKQHEEYWELLYPKNPLPPNTKK